MHTGLKDFLHEYLYKKFTNLTDFERERIYLKKRGILYNFLIKTSLERYNFAKKYISKNINSNSKVRVLDIACGTGYGSKILADAHINVFAVDIADVFEKSENPNIIFDVMDATKLEFSNNFFDVIVSFETIEHIKKYSVFLSEIKRTLKRNGLLILSTPNLTYTKKLFGKYHKDWDPYHIKEFTTEEIYALLNDRFNVIDTLIQFPTPTNSLLLAVFNGIINLFRIPRVVWKKKNTAGIFNIFICKNSKKNKQ